MDFSMKSKHILLSINLLILNRLTEKYVEKKFIVYFHNYIKEVLCKI